MSGALTWLHGQRKTELTALAEQVGLKDYENLKKSELETALDEHMRANQGTLAKESNLQAFFKRISGSPIKKESMSTELTKTPRARRATRAREDTEPTDISEPELSKDVAPYASRTSLTFASAVPLPPSPAVVATQIDKQTAIVRSKVSGYWDQSGISEATQNLRDKLSSTMTIETLAIAVELFGMQKDILPLKYLPMLPASETLGTPAFPLKVPDLFVLLNPAFWSVFTLWLGTSVILPLTFSYFFNLSLKSKHGQVKHAKNIQPSAQYDPLTYNIAKALVAWLVYGKGFNFYGLVGSEHIERLETAIPGGLQGVLIGASIGCVTSIYEAVLKK